MRNFRLLALALIPVVLLGLPQALGQTRVTADQGRPGNQGPWPVTIVGGTGGGGGTTIISGPDGGAAIVQGTVIVVGPDGGAVVVQDLPCTQPIETVLVYDGGASVPCPLPLPGRRTVVLCNSPLNTGTPAWKVRIDGTPVTTMAVTTPGQPLMKSDCERATINSVSSDGGTQVWCLSDTAGAVIVSTECK